MRLKTTLIAAIAMITCSASPAYSCERITDYNRITKDNIERICPKLEVSKKSLTGERFMVEIKVPDDEKHLEGLTQAWLVISVEEGKISLKVPTPVYELHEHKRIFFTASPEMLENAVIKLDCDRGPTVSSLRTLTLDLRSLLEIEK